MNSGNINLHDKTQWQLGKIAYGPAGCGVWTLEILISDAFTRGLSFYPPNGTVKPRPIGAKLPSPRPAPVSAELGGPS
jgi:hypothetical protein